MVQEPCLACELLRRARRRIYRADFATGSELGLEIREPDARRRQEALAAEKRLRGETMCSAQDVRQDH